MLLIYPIPTIPRQAVEGNGEEPVLDVVANINDSTNVDVDELLLCSPGGCARNGTGALAVVGDASFPP